MKVLLPWAQIQEAMATRFDEALAATALASKSFNYIPQSTQYPFQFFGEFESDDSEWTKGLDGRLITHAAVEIYSGEAGNQEAVALTSASLAAMTATPLVLSSSDFKVIGTGQLRDSPSVSQEFDGTGVVWVGRYRVSFWTKQTTV